MIALQYGRGPTGLSPHMLINLTIPLLKVGLEAEYQEIRNRDPTGTFYHARMSANVLKNRYTDVPSYDHSRVVLATESSDNKEDEDPA